LNIQANSAQLVDIPDISNIPPKYYKFANIFSKAKAEVLTPHHSYDLKINLKESIQPLVSSIK